MPHRGDGPIPSRVMVVGEAWGKDEDDQGRPFVGAAGAQLNSVLHDAGIMRAECYVTNVVNHRPFGNDLRQWIAFSKKEITKEHVDWRGWKVKPIVVQGHQQLLAEIEMVKPNVIVPVGNLALHALVDGCIGMSKNGKGPTGMKKWRGSQLRMDLSSPVSALRPKAAGTSPKVIPTWHPAFVLRTWSERATMVNDLRRVARHMDTREYYPPRWNFIVRPNFSQVMEKLYWLLQMLDQGSIEWLELDLETRGKHIACAALSWTKLDSLCIPFMCVDRSDGYWNEEEEAQIIFALYKVMTHPKVKIRWQNGLYDAQYTHRHWHFVPRGYQDTMISQHMLWSDQPKALAYQASTFCDWYIYWKDEGKDWNINSMPEDQLWSYNCMDDVHTREVGEVELQIVQTYKQRAEKNEPGGWPQAEKIHQFQQALFWPVLKAMNRGVRIIEENRNKLAMEVEDQIAHRQETLNAIIGYPINVDSPKQIQGFFYEEMGLPVIYKKRGKGVPPTPTCDDDALRVIATREILMRPIVNCIADIRTLNHFHGFILAPADVDGRMRCSYNIGGSESGKSAPKTYRLSSSKNAFGSGDNLQNIPSEKSKSVGKAAQRGHIAMLGDPYQLPNIRSVYGPDYGFTFFDLDLDRSDLQTVVWESNDVMLKEALRKGVDIHLLNAYIIANKEPPPMDELVEKHPKYPDHRAPMKLEREFAKVFCHGTNFGGGPKTMAANTGRLMHEIDRAQKIWFGAHPGIKAWHNDVRDQVMKRRYVENKFGYRWYIFDRLESIIPEAIGWIPQSTTSIVINKIWMNLFQGCTEESWDLSVDHLYKLFHQRTDIEVTLQVHDSLAGQFPTHKKEQIVPKILSLSHIVVPYDDPLIIPTGIGTSEVNWGAC